MGLGKSLGAWQNLVRQRTFVTIYLITFFDKIINLLLHVLQVGLVYLKEVDIKSPHQKQLFS